MRGSVLEVESDDNLRVGEIGRRREKIEGRREEEYVDDGLHIYGQDHWKNWKGRGEVSHPWISQRERIRSDT